MFKKPKTDPGLDAVIADCERELLSLNADSAEYKETLSRYKDLQALRAGNQPKSLSPDAILNAAASLAGIAMILNYERAAAMTSKAVGFVKRIT